MIELEKEVKKIIAELNDKTFTVAFCEQAVKYPTSAYHNAAIGYVLACQRLAIIRLKKKCKSKIVFSAHVGEEGE